MAAILLYQWNSIPPGATVSVFVHGFTRDQLGTCDAIPYNIGNIGTAYTPLYSIKLAQGQVGIHVDGTYARTASVQNLAPFNATGAGLFFVHG